MEKEILLIHDIPSIIWGLSSNKVIIAIHGNQSNKADSPIELLARVAFKKGYQVLSFDLPEHGDRKDQETLCKAKECVNDLQLIMQYAKDNWQEMSLFANSIGAYFSLLAYPDEPLKNAWFLSPVVDMQWIIENMMRWFQISEAQLEKKQIMSTSIGETLYWDDYCYVKENPINKWNVQTHILYGDQDEMCEKDAILGFAKNFNCQLQIVEECEHYFHTPYQLEELAKWLNEIL